MSLTFLDYADYDLLHVVDDAQKQHGQGMDTDYFAGLLEVERRSVGTRFARMRSWGLLSKDARTGGWIVGRKGRALLNGRGKDLEAVRRLTLQMAANETARWVTMREVKKNLGARR